MTAGAALALGSAVGGLAGCSSGPKGTKRPAGLVGDGQADDTFALRRAIAESGDRLELPRGTYRITERLTLSRPVTIRGEGSDRTVVFLDLGRATTGVVVDGRGVTLEGLAIDASRTPTASGVYALLVQGPDFVGTGLDVFGSGGAIVSGTENPTWRDCSSPIWLRGVAKGLVERCAIEGSMHHTRMALVSDGSRGCTVRDNSFRRTLASDAPDPAVDVQGSADVEISGNEIDSSAWYGINVERSSRVRVTDNSVWRPGHLRSDGGSTVTGIELVAAAETVVAGNRVRDCGGYGIAVVDCSAAAGVAVRVERNAVARCGDPGVSLQRCRGVVVAMNHVEEASWGFTVGEDSNNCERVEVVENRFDRCPYGGGYVRGSSSCVVARNAFTACGEDPKVQDRADAVLVLWDDQDGRAVTSTTVTDNTAVTGAGVPGASAGSPPAQFVRTDAAGPFPSHARDVVIARNRLG